MDEVTQQNSALVEENAATAKTLEHQAMAMNERVAFFRLDEPGAAPDTSRPFEVLETGKGGAPNAATPTPLLTVERAPGSAPIKRAMVGRMPHCKTTRIGMTSDETRSRPILSFRTR